jgi:type IV secretory pathway TrbD component
MEPQMQGGTTMMIIISVILTAVIQLILFTYVKNSGNVIWVACHHSMTHPPDEVRG